MKNLELAEVSNVFRPPAGLLVLLQIQQTDYLHWHPIVVRRDAPGPGLGKIAAGNLVEQGEKPLPSYCL